MTQHDSWRNDAAPIFSAIRACIDAIMPDDVEITQKMTIAWNALPICLEDIRKEVVSKISPLIALRLCETPTATASKKRRKEYAGLSLLEYNGLGRCHKPVWSVANRLETPLNDDVLWIIDQALKGRETRDDFVGDIYATSLAKAVFESNERHFNDLTLRNKLEPSYPAKNVGISFNHSGKGCLASITVKRKHNLVRAQIKNFRINYKKANVINYLGSTLEIVDCNLPMAAVVSAIGRQIKDIIDADVFSKCDSEIVSAKFTGNTAVFGIKEGQPQKLTLPQ